MRVSQNKGYHFGDPHNKDYSILGSILGSPYFGKPPWHSFVMTFISAASSRRRSALRVFCRIKVRVEGSRFTVKV